MFRDEEEFFEGNERPKPKPKAFSFKKYISRYSTGPHGLGDPDDRTLRKIERDTIVDNMLRERVREVYCAEEMKEFMECGAKIGLLLMSWKCKTFKHKLAECLDKWNEDDELRLKIKNEYLDERAEYRRTGMTKEEREKLEEYIKDGHITYDPDATYGYSG